MRYFLRALALVALFSAPALAQDNPRVEIFGGFSAGRAAGEGLVGWHASAAGNVNSWFGVVADYSRHTSSIERPTPFGAFDVDGTVHTVLFGPRFSARQSDRVTPFAHVLVGASTARVTAGVLGLRLSESDTGFAVATGVGLDITASRHVGVRLAQFDYIRSRFDGRFENAFRYSAGITLRF